LDDAGLRPETRFMIFVTVLLLVFAVALACAFAWYSSVLN
jgi:type VI protein secretion system component VasF